MNRLQKDATGVYRPGTPGVPGRAAYCTYTPIYQTRISYASSYTPLSMDALLSLMMNNRKPFDLVGDGSGEMYVRTYGNRATNTQYLYAYREQCYPAIPTIPATPARFDYTGTMGWDASARSVEPVPANGYFRATIPAPASAVAFGLSGRVFGGSIGAMSHAVVVRPGGVTLREQGVDVKNLASGVGRWELRRKDGRVEYYLNDGLVHVSATPLTGDAYAVGMLYSLADMIDSPSIAAMADERMSADVDLPALRLVASTEPDRQAASIFVPPLRVMATLASRPAFGSVAVALPSLRVLASTVASGGQAKLALPEVRVSARLGDIEAAPSGAALTVPMPMLMTSDRTIGHAAADLDVPVLAVLASDRPLQGFAKIPMNLTLGVFAAEPWFPDGYFVDNSLSLATTSMELETPIVLSITSYAVAETFMDLSLSIELEITSWADGEFLPLLEQVEELHLYVQALARTSFDITQRAATQYVTNVETGAMGRFVGLEFDGFVRVAGFTYGYRSDGVFLIEEGAGDDGLPICASVDLGFNDYGTSRGKRVDSAHVGLRTDGVAHLRVQGDHGQALKYRLLECADTRHARLAKGVHAKHWNFKLMVEDATFADVGSFEVRAGETRRITGRRGLN